MEKRIIPILSLVRYALIGTALGYGFSPAPSRAGEDSIPEVTLESLLSEVRHANPGLQAAKARYLEALAEAPQEGSLADPRFMFQYMILPGETRAGPQRYRFEIEQEFPFWGVRGLRESAATQQAEMSRSDASSAEFDLALETKNVFFEWWYIERALEINRINRDLLSAFRKAAEDLYRSGQAPQSDPLKAAVELARTGAAEAALVRMQKVAVARIRSLIGTSGEPVRGRPVLPDVPVVSPDPEAARAIALGHRPELTGADAQVFAAKNRTEIAYKGYWPDLSLGLMYAPTKGGTNPGFPEDGMDDLAIRAGIDIPLQLNRRRAAIAQSEAGVRAAEYSRDSVRNRIVFEVIETSERLTEAVRVRDLYRKEILPAADLELRSARQAYVSARIGFTSLLDSERSYIGVLLEEAEAVRMYWQSLAMMERALGVSLMPGNLPCGGTPPACGNDGAPQ